MDWKEVGEKARDARLKKGLSQADVACELGVSSAFICQIEAGQKKPSAENLIKLSKLLRVKFF